MNMFSYTLLVDIRLLSRIKYIFLDDLLLQLLEIFDRSDRKNIHRILFFPKGRPKTPDRKLQAPM